MFFEQVERLFNVFNVGTPKGDRRKTMLDMHLVEKAIDRSLLARSVRLTNTGKPIRRWAHSSSSIWDRLQACCRIGTHVAGGQLRTSIQEHLDTHLAEASAQSGESSGIMSLLEVVDGCKWLDRTTVDWWHQRMWDRWLALEGSIEEPLEGLSSTARWFMSKRDGFDSQQAQIVQEKLTKAVKHEIACNTDRNDPQRLEGNLALIEEIATTLRLDFSTEIDRLNEALNDCGSSDGDDSNEDWRSHEDACNSSIESLFEALLE